MRQDRCGGRKRSAARRSGDARRLYPAPVRRWPCLRGWCRAWPDAACSALLIGPARHARSAPRVDGLGGPAQGRPWHVGRYDDDPPGDRVLRHAVGSAVHGRPSSPCRSAGADCGRLCHPTGHRHPGLRRRLLYWFCFCFCRRPQSLACAPARWLRVLREAWREQASVACATGSCSSALILRRALFGAGASGRTGLGAVIAAARPLRC
ncbi:hypothetical protein M2324_001555 [Rhodovulum sulfidophilum]|nr:hypothetical protein [Rhodovulum sulfidophilum]